MTDLLGENEKDWPCQVLARMWRNWKFHTCWWEHKMVQSLWWTLLVSRKNSLWPHRCFFDVNLLSRPVTYFWSKNYGTYVLEIFNNFGSLHYVWKCDLWRFSLLWKSTLRFYVNAKLLLRYICEINNYLHVVHWFYWHIFFLFHKLLFMFSISWSTATH